MLYLFTMVCGGFPLSNLIVYFARFCLHESNHVVLHNGVSNVHAKSMATGKSIQPLVLQTSTS